MKAMHTAILAIVLSGTPRASLAAAPVKKVLLEEFTVTWCHFCPSVGVLLDKLHVESPKNIVVSYHVENDNMSTPMQLDWQDAYYGVDGYPSAFMDRGSSSVDPRNSSFKTALSRQQALAAQVGIAFRKMKWDASTRTVSGELAASFTESLSGSFGFGLIITENKVVGGNGRATLVNGAVKKDPDAYDKGYDQTADRDVVANFPTLKYTNGEILGYPHPWVARAAPFGVTGKSGVIPQSVKADSSYALPFTYQVPEKYDPTPLGVPVKLANIGLVAFVVKSGSSGKTILNCDLAMLADYLEGTRVLPRDRLHGKALASVQEISGAAFVTVRTASAGAYGISLYDTRGTVVAKLDRDLEAGLNRILLPRAAFRNGSGILIAKAVER